MKNIAKKAFVVGALAAGTFDVNAQDPQILPSAESEKAEIVNVLESAPQDTSKTISFEDAQEMINNSEGNQNVDENRWTTPKGIDVHGIVQVNSKNIAPDYISKLSDNPNGVLHLDFSKAFAKNNEGIKLGLAIDRIQELAKTVNPAVSGNVYNPYIEYSHKFSKGQLTTGVVGEYTQMDDGLRCFTPNIYGNYSTGKGWTFGTKVRVTDCDARDVALKASAAKTFKLEHVFNAITAGVNAWYMSNPGVGNNVFRNITVNVDFGKGFSVNLSGNIKDGRFEPVGGLMYAF